MLNNSELESLKAVFSEYSEIEGVYLFGSAASDKKAEYEDIDVGIVYSDPVIEEKKVDLYAALVKKGLDNVDIVFFNSADLVLQFEIIHHNKLIYRKEGFNHGELFSLTVRKYFDFKPYLDRQREAYKKRILNG
jgi:predicted nucleotidyltransferase